MKKFSQITNINVSKIADKNNNDYNMIHVIRSTIRKYVFLSSYYAIRKKCDY